jgi:hypothetical protein
VLQGGYLNVNRGSTNRSGWNRIIGSFMVSKSTNNLKIMEKSVRCDDATNMHGRGRYRNFGRRSKKE